MQPTHPQKRREPIKVIGEHKFYLAEKADEMYHTRHMVAEVNELFIKAGISEAFLSKIAQLAIDTALSANDLNTLRQDVIALGQNLQGRLGMLADFKMYEDLACVYFLMDDEPMEFDESFQGRKKAVWRSANEQDFFTIWAFNNTEGSPNISKESILAAWQAVSERLSQLPTLID